MWVSVSFLYFCSSFPPVCQEIMKWWPLGAVRWAEHLARPSCLFQEKQCISLHSWGVSSPGVLFPGQIFAVGLHFVKQIIFSPFPLQSLSFCQCVLKSSVLEPTCLCGRYQETEALWTALTCLPISEFLEEIQVFSQSLMQITGPQKLP